jgi:GNAT superfamily N-acetyltransferase
VSPSIGFATDLAVREAEGASVERIDRARIVRTPGNPGFRWGNFVLLDGGAVEEGPEAWSAVHRRAFPDADFVTIGLDEADARFDEEAWRGNGFAVERSVVLRAAAGGLSGNGTARIRPVVSDADWADVLTIDADVEPPGETDYAAFAAARVAAERRAVTAGRAVWLGAEEDGRLVASLGVVAAAGGLARYQNVQTLQRYRRRGLAGALVLAGARVAAAELGRESLVIVAEEPGPAIGLYRRLGFVAAETQVQLTLMR